MDKDVIYSDLIRKGIQLKVNDVLIIGTRKDEDEKEFAKINAG